MTPISSCMRMHLKNTSDFITYITGECKPYLKFFAYFAGVMPNWRRNAEMK